MLSHLTPYRFRLALGALLLTPIACDRAVSFGKKPEPTLSELLNELEAADAISERARRTVEVPAPPEPFPIAGTFIPSGRMGDGALSGSDAPLGYEIVRADGTPSGFAERWRYEPAKGRMGWAGCAYQFPANNWGELPGKDFSVSGFTRFAFLARSLRGPARLEVRSGGNTRSRHAASYEIATVVILSEEWRTYTIPLVEPDGTPCDLSSIASAFSFVISGTQRAVEFLLADLRFE